MLIILEFFVHAFLMALANLLTILLRYEESTRLLISMFLRAWEISLINNCNGVLSSINVFFNY